MDILELSKRYAIACHKSVNHLYDGKPYEIHLEMAVQAAIKFSYLIPHYDLPIVLASVWSHDVIEDTRQTYNDVWTRTSWRIAPIVYALTNEKGKTRKERANRKYYRDIRRTEYATFVKLCDRMANVDYSRMNNKKMFELYKKENPKFIKSLKKNWIEKLFYPAEPSYKPMFTFLENLFKEN